MTVDYGQSIPHITEAARRNVINRVENLTGLRVTEVNIVVSDVQIPEQQQAVGARGVDDTQSMEDRGTTLRSFLLRAPVLL